MEADTKLFTSSHRFARISPQKARLVMDLIRGKAVDDALNTLRFCQRRASPMIRKVLRSAVANAAQRAGVEGEDLVVWRATVDDGPRAKRWRPRAQGRAYSRIRRYCHLMVSLKQTEKKQGEKKAGGGKQPKGAAANKGASGKE
jgi:large subunit ribosomal protein L22